MRELVFPSGFLWGASTSGYQTEGGGDRTDWWAFEQAGRAAEPSGRACDSWNRWQEDLDLAAELGLNTYRISIEWARIEPTPGRFDAEALAHYVDVVRGIRERGMTCMVVLWHFTLPVWLDHRSGTWRNGRAPEAFERYVRYVCGPLAPYVDWWATLNETNTYSSHGWLKGDWPPGHKHDWPGAVRVYEFMARGHRLAYSAIKETAGPGARVGLTHVMPWIHPAEKGSLFSQPLAAYWRWLVAHHFLDKVRSELDWLGVQYYYDTPVRTFRLVDERRCAPADRDGLAHRARGSLPRGPRALRPLPACRSSSPRTASPTARTRSVSGSCSTTSPGSTRR